MPPTGLYALAGSIRNLDCFSCCTKTQQGQQSEAMQSPQPDPPMWNWFLMLLLCNIRGTHWSTQQLNDEKTQHYIWILNIVLKLTKGIWWYCTSKLQKLSFRSPFRRVEVFPNRQHGKKQAQQPAWNVTVTLVFWSQYWGLTGLRRITAAPEWIRPFSFWELIGCWGWHGKTWQIL